MEKKDIRAIICMLGILLSVTLIQTEAIGKKPMYQPEWKHPDPTVTIVLRAPMSESPHLIISSEAEDEKHIKGLAVSLPKYTPVFFKVDQVNTVLYTITIKKEKSEAVAKAKPAKTFSVDAAYKLIEQARRCCRKKSAKAAFNALAGKVKAVNGLNKELDKLLKETESPQFYTAGAAKVAAAFVKIATDAKKLTKNNLKLLNGTAQEICDDAEAALQKVHRVCKGKKKEILPHIPEDLSDPSNAIVAVFTTTAEKLRAIETSTWSKTDTETRILKDEMKYICVFTPKEKNTKLKSITHEVRVTPTTGLSGIRFTAGPFMTDLRDDHYISIKDKIALGGQDRFAMPLGGLAHAIIFGQDFSRLSWAFALSTGFALGTGAADGTFLVNGQAALGGSLLFSEPGGEGNTFAVTVGGIAKPVKRLNGYWVGDPFPKGPDQPTRSVYRGGWFIALTANFDFVPRIFGLKKTTASK